MNDEDFARNVFRHTMESSFAGEPTGLPSLDDITARARRGNRAKQGVYAASAVALAGVVTAGVVAGPSVLGLGSGTPETSAAGQTGGATPAGTGAPPDKAKVATACPTRPQIDWASIISQQVAGITVTPVSKASAPDQNSCHLLPDGSMNIEVLFDTGNPTGVVQIDVNTGGSKNGRASTSASATPDASELASSQALKRKMASEAATSAAADRAKEEALARLATQKPTGAATNSQATKSPANTAVKSPEPTPTCTGAKETQVVCTMDVGKGGYVGMSAALTRTTPTPLFVQVIASTSAPATPGQHAPLTSTQLSAIAQAVAAHF
ncbi:MAG TPA: hypothetical protein VF218_10255 [Acidothermaceae bacterium]